MGKQIVRRLFQIRPGEGRIASLMFAYIFLAVAVLLMVKPAINSLFLSSMGADQLPLAFLLVCLSAIVSSWAYQKLLKKYRLRRIIRGTLWSSVGVLVSLALLEFTNSLTDVGLYVYYIWVSLFGIMAASQFWMLANLVFNVREAKRLFGFIGAGGISGGILGGYLTSVLSPMLGLGITLLVAAGFVVVNTLLFERIWQMRIRNLGALRQENRRKGLELNPLKLIRDSEHLTVIALLVAVGVLVAKLVDYLFSDMAARSIEDPEELASFFGFWYSSFNLMSLGIQVVLTRRIVGVWGVGTSLLLLPAGILVSGAVFFVFPELIVVIAMKALDGVLKQSVNKSAFEMLALPLSLEVKQRTKYFIDVVVDSLATGLAGLLLIGMVNGLELNNHYIQGLILLLSAWWIVMILRVRGTYYRAFRDNLTTPESMVEKRRKRPAKRSMLGVMRGVLQSGNEKQQLYMLNKLGELRDPRLADDVQALLGHPSLTVRTAAIRVLQALNVPGLPTDIPRLLNEGDEELTLAVMDYLLMQASQNPHVVFDTYLDHPDGLLRACALFALSRDSRDNPALRQRYGLERRMGEAMKAPGNRGGSLLMRSIGAAAYKEGYPLLHASLASDDPEQLRPAILAAGLSMDADFLEPLIQLLTRKETRQGATDALIALGPGITPLIADGVREGRWSLEICRFIPHVLKGFGTQAAVDQLFGLFDDFDLGVRLEVVRALSEIRTTRPHLRFDRMEVVRRIYDECRLYHQTLTAMHSQIISSYRMRRKGKGEVSTTERESRSALLDLLENRLESGLERIFGLLGLKYPLRDMERALHGMRSNREEDRARTLEFLDNLLTGNLREKLLPILEEGAREWTAEEEFERPEQRVPTEFECFGQLLELRDQRLVLAVLRLLGDIGEPRYQPLVAPLRGHMQSKIREEAGRTFEKLG